MKATTGDRLKIIMSERNIKQVDILELTKKFQSTGVKITKTDLSQYVNGKTEPRQDKLYILAKALDVNEAWLMGYDAKKERIPDNERKIEFNNINCIYNQLENKRKKKVYSFAEQQLEEQNKVVEFSNKINVLGQTAAGAPVDYGDSDIEEKEFKTVPKGAQYALNVKGDSMEPLIMDGSIVFYKEQPSVENGEIAIVELDGEGVTCKKVCFNFGEDKIILRSLNEKYEDMSIDAHQVRIIGKVVL